MKDINRFTFLAFLILVPVFSAAQTVRHGILENGLNYYIVKNTTPEKEVYMKLVVNAGEEDEDPEELGLAHVVEHLGFLATENFPSGLRKFFDGSGAMGMNGSTNIITEYHLSLPNDKTEVIDMGLMALRDWAGGISFNIEDVNEAKAAVVRELSSADRPSFFAGKLSVYLQFEKHPFYDPKRTRRIIENVKNSSPDRIIGFYKKWYHPLYQALIIVGDVDDKKIEEKVRREFSLLSNSNFRKKEDPASRRRVSLSGKDQLIVVSRGNDTGTAINVLVSKKKEGVSQSTPVSIEGFRSTPIDKIFTELMRHRFEVSALDRNISGVQLDGVTHGQFHPASGVDIFSCEFNVQRSGEIREKISFIAQVLHQVEQHGFSEEEFIRAREAVVGSFSDRSGQKMNSVKIASGLTDHYIDGSPLPDQGIKIMHELLDNITLKQVNDRAIFWTSNNGNTDVIISVPDSTGLKLPTKERVFSWITEAYAESTEPYKEERILSLPSIKESKRVVTSSITLLGQLDAARVTLSNGATIILKQLKDDPNGNQVIVRAIHREPLNAARNNQVDLILKNIRSFSRFGSMNASQLARWNEQQNRIGSISVKPTFANGMAEISGHSDVNSVELMFHLINLYMNSAEADKDAFKDYVQRTLSDASHDSLPGMGVLMDTIMSILGKREDGSPISITDDPSNLKQAFEIYHQQFNDVSNFVFVVTGNFEEHQMVKLLEQYIGCLPGSGNRTISKPRPSKKESVNLQRCGFDPSANVLLTGDATGNVEISMLLPVAIGSDEANRLKLDVLGNVLHHRLLSRLRKKEQVVYDIAVSIRPGRCAEFFMDIRFEVPPSDIDRTVGFVKDEFEKIGDITLDDQTLAHAIAPVISRVSNEMLTASYWNRYLSDRVRNDNLSSPIFQRIKFLNEITSADVTNLFRNSIDTEQCMVIKVL